MFIRMPTAEFLHKFLILPLLTATVVVNGLKLDRVVTPKKVHIGDVAVLKCPFELGKDRLYSVKWYKDGEEFFRYIPKYNPPMSEKAVNGVKVQVMILIFSPSQLAVTGSAETSILYSKYL